MQAAHEHAHLILVEYGAVGPKAADGSVGAVLGQPAAAGAVDLGSVLERDCRGQRAPSQPRLNTALGAIKALHVVAALQKRQCLVACCRYALRFVAGAATAVSVAHCNAVQV